ncbi:helix-turn-helix domain-containing protein [Clostridium sp. JS66]|uniref:helix-turn-helix domain-containing protein n=1 Tax=Clostridium sp. JS66 TaxID=3064705 RepID=UPI00298EBC65|nr:helix-turn-helix domain-containing protein [Clostridium sp. JS66]WPC42792.1 helix-turn-helix domain-containing protein [Clostridium sp. JS66]
MESKAFTVKEVAKILNLSEYTVRELIHQGKLKKLNIDKPIRVSQSAIDKLLDLDTNKSQVSNQIDIVLKKKEVLDLISTITSLQSMTNQILIMLQNKLK